MAVSASTSNGNNRVRGRRRSNKNTEDANGNANVNGGNGNAVAVMAAAETQKAPLTTMTAAAAETARSNTNKNGGGRKPRQRQPQKKNNNGATTTTTAAAVPAPVAGDVNVKQKKADRKMGKRAKQLLSMEKKAKAEDEFFRQCQREAASTASTSNTNNKQQKEQREMALFGKQGAQGINFAKYNDITVDVKSGGTAADKTKHIFSDFDELQLPPAMRKNVRLMNYAKSTPIQKHAIPLGIAGNDLMCCAQTGSGKTCAFLLPVVISLAKNQNQSGSDIFSDSAAASGMQNKEPVKPKCIVLAPTRELASQIELEAEKLCFNQPGLAPVAVYGGASQQKQLRQLAFAGGSSIIIVATPGRLTDFVDRNLISLRHVQFLVLDEADRMLDMGFEPQIRKLVLRSHMTPKASRQTAMFSATFPDKIQKLASEFLRSDYTWIAVGRVGSTTDSITQVVKEATADKRHKLKLVVEAVQGGPEGRTLIFVQKKRSATWLKKQLSKGGPEGWDFTFDPIEAVEIHGDRSQSQREAALAKFRSGACRILVATDVAARGLDISGVEHVINMDLPFSADEFDSYVHRIGRTGRAGHTGLATSFYVPGDAPKVGNRKIAGKLIQQLKEAKQEVPSFLEADCAGGGGGGSGGNSGAKQRDVRGSGGRGGGRGGRGGGRGGRSGGRGGRGRGNENGGGSKM